MVPQSTIDACNQCTSMGQGQKGYQRGIAVGRSLPSTLKLLAVSSSGAARKGLVPDDFLPSSQPRVGEASNFPGVVFPTAHEALTRL